MKKLSFLMFALVATMMMFAQEATAYKVTWVTNGVELPTKPTSNEDLWEAFKPYYKEFYNENRSDQPIAAVATFMTKGEKIMTDPTSDYKWLGEYMLNVTNDQIASGALKTYTGITTEVKWRFASAAFFNCKAANDADYSGNADFTEAGKIENWIGAWVKANALPETMTSEDAMPTLEREGYTLVGWYDNAELTGEPVTSVTADVTLYAKWEAVAYKVTWVTNGVEMPVAPTSNEDLWEAFKPYYKEFYNENRSDQPIAAVATFMTKGEKIMTDPTSDYKWLGEYMLNVTNDQIASGALKTYTGITTEVKWRFASAAFFNCKAANDADYSGNADFTEAGKIENWIGAWKAANWLPETMTIEDPMPVLEKPEYTFLGWYDNEACTGDIVTKVTKECTLYAGWERAVYHVDFVAPYAYPNNMYVDDVYELAYALQEDYNAAYSSSKEWAKMEDGQVYYNINGEWKLPKDAQGQDPTVTGFIQNVSYNTTDNFKNLLEAEGSKWAWMKTAIEAQRVKSEIADALDEGTYRKEVGAIFLQSPKSSTAWKNSASWEGFNADSIVKAFGQEVILPDTIAEDYTLPTMYRKNYTFDGWYWEEDFSGEAVTVVPVKSNGTLYAKFTATEFALLGIELSKKDTVELQMPATDTLSVIFKPETAVNKNVTWSSSDENVLVVENGVVTPKGPGVATVKVVSEESELVATVVYNVKARVGAVTGVTLDKTALTLALGETATLVATVAPEDAVDKSLTWASDGKAVSVDSVGVIKADTVGTATITVTTVDGGYTATCKVTVPEPINADVKVEKLWEVAIPASVANTGDVRNGMGYAGKFYLTDKNTKKIRVFTQAGEDVDAAIAINDADVTVTHNEWTYTYDTLIVDQDTTISVKDSVANPVSTVYALGTGIAIDDAGNIVFGTGFPNAVKAIGIIKKGETKPTIIEVALPTTGRTDQITAFGDIFSEEGGLVALYPQNATQVQLVKIANGQLVEAKALAGEVKAGASPSQVLYATETEAWAHSRGNATQYVKDGEVTNLDLKNLNTSDLGGARIMIGENEVYTYKVGTTHSSEFAVRNMTAGQFAADKEGNTVHYVVDKAAASNNSYANFTKAEKINDYAYYLYVFTSGKGAGVFKVYQEVAVESVALDQTTATVKAGEKLQLTATVTPSYATITDVVWSTSDSTIAIVDQNGLVQAVKAGEATITATTVDGGKVAECALTVKAVYYHRAMSVAELTAGKKMLIVNAGDTLAMAQANKNNFGQVAIAPEEGILSDVPAEATIITIEKDSVFALAVEGGYLFAGTSSSNYLRVQENRDELAEWDITIDEAGLATIVCHSSKSKRNTIRYNKQSEIFSAYESGKQEDVVIFVEYDPEAPQIRKDEITNLVFDLEAWPMTCSGGPSTEYGVEVYLVLGEDNGSGQFVLTEESSIAVGGQDATFISGYLYDVDAYAPEAKAVIVAQVSETETYEFHLTMSAAPIEATVVVVENAVVEVEKFEIFEGMYEHSLKMTGVWTDAEGLDYPVTVDVPVYYPEATEPYEMMSTVIVGTITGNWLGFGEGYLTITTVGDVVTATGVVENPNLGIAIDITISGKLETTALENIEVGTAATKVIKNGQLFIIRGEVEYNAQGQMVK